MLVFQRELGEEVVITFQGINGPETCVISVQAIRGERKIRLGFEAGPDVRIDRKEIYLARLEGEKPNQPLPERRRRT